MIGLVLLLIIFASTLSGHAPFLVAVADGLLQHNSLARLLFRATLCQGSTPHGHVLIYSSYTVFAHKTGSLYIF